MCSKGQLVSSVFIDVVSKSKSSIRECFYISNNYNKFNNFLVLSFISSIGKVSAKQKMQKLKEWTLFYQNQRLSLMVYWIIHHWTGCH